MSWIEDGVTQLEHSWSACQEYSTVDRVRRRISQRPSDFELSNQLFTPRRPTLSTSRGDVHREEELSFESRNDPLLEWCTSSYGSISQMDTVSSEYFYDYLLRYPRVALHYSNWFSTCKPSPPSTGSPIDMKMWSLAMIVRGSTMMKRMDDDWAFKSYRCLHSSSCDLFICSPLLSGWIKPHWRNRSCHPQSCRSDRCWVAKFIWSTDDLKSNCAARIKNSHRKQQRNQ